MNYSIQTITTLSIFINRQLKEHTFFYAVLLSSFLLLFRAESLDFITNSLWAEDGAIFFNQAVLYGIKSLFTSYNGYFLFYQRIITFIGIEFPLNLLPYIFFIGWYCAYILLLWYLVNFGKKININIKLLLIFSGLLALIPNEGELYFTLTNSQWFLGCAILLLFITPNKEFSNPFDLFVIAIIGLTGPFILLLLPIFFLNLVINKDFEQKKWGYIIVFVCSMIQLFFILNSVRLEGVTASAGLAEWLVVFVKILLFGSEYHIISLMFWGTFLYSIKVNLDQNKQMFYFSAIFLSGFIVLIVSLYMTQHVLSMLSPLGGGSRYFFIFYLCLFLSSFILASNSKTLSFIIPALVIMICFLNVTPMTRPHLQWEAFVKFAKVNSNLVIPINPIFETYPGWNLSPGNRYFNNRIKNNTEIINISPKSFIDVSNASTKTILDISKFCQNVFFIGIEVEIKDNKEGLAKAYWSNNHESFSENNSLIRYYPSGNITMQFAFKRENNENYIKIETKDETLLSKIQNVKLYCLN